MRVSDDAQKGALAAVLLTLGDTKESPGALLAEGEKIVESQQKIITELQKENSELQDKLQVLQNERGKAKDLLTESIQHTRDMQSNMLIVRKREEQLKQKLKEARGSFKSQEEENAELKTNCSKLESQLAVSKQQYQTLTEMNTQYCLEKVKYEEQIQNLTQKFEKSKKAFLKRVLFIHEEGKREAKEIIEEIEDWRAAYAEHVTKRDDTDEINEVLKDVILHIEHAFLHQDSINPELLFKLKSKIGIISNYFKHVSTRSTLKQEINPYCIYLSHPHHHRIPLPLLSHPPPLHALAPQHLLPIHIQKLHVIPQTSVRSPLPPSLPLQVFLHVGPWHHTQKRLAVVWQR